MPDTDPLIGRLRGRLERLYGARAEACAVGIRKILARHSQLTPRKNAHDRLWNQRDVVLITYGDQLHKTGQTPLQTLREFLLANGLAGVISTIHLLPFFPYSSDDGFSVIDYRAVDPNLGTWDDVQKLGHEFGLMFDLVLNHCSQQSDWFGQFLAGNEPGTRYFIEADPAADLSAVTRPRSSHLLTEFETDRGTRHVWTTFSADQVDLNFSEPDVLLEMIDVLLCYVGHGARIIRLDAIAYLWKQIGTSCIHLAETHEVVKLFRELLDEVAPGTILLTETNVPHEENVSYFGAGDEAQMVYQFSLAPLLLDAFLNGDAGPFMEWLCGLVDPPPGCAFFNFTASHDGIGLRPLEGLVSADRLQRLLDAVRKRGGLVSTKRNPNGSDTPYELNITYFDALSDPQNPDPQQHARRFLASQALMLALRGIPGIYFHSLVGTPNDTEGVEQTRRARTINRRKFERGELQARITQPDSAQNLVFDAYRAMLATRVAQPAFHPDAPQQAIETGNRGVISFLRTSLDGRQKLFVLGNVTNSPQTVDLTQCAGGEFTMDRLAGQRLTDATSLRLAPWQTVWLQAAG